MADVFLSYARDDQDRARDVAEALEARGWSVFWDYDILGGQEFRPVLERELHSARCVVVLWSERALASKFVRDEAAEALDGRLVPALIDRVEPPLGFREIQHTDLSEWRGDPSDQAFARLAASVQAIVGGHPPPPPPVEGGWQPTLRRVGGLRILVLATSGALVLAIAASFVVRVPADIDLDVHVRNVSVHMNGADDIALFTGLRLETLTLQNLETVTSLSDVFVTVADPSRKAALTAKDVANFTLNVPPHAGVQFSASPDEPGLLKVVFTGGPASAVFTAGEVRAMRCVGCAEADAAVLASLVGKRGSLQVRGDPERTTVLFSSASPVSVAALDVDSIGFGELVDQRFVSTVLDGTMAFRSGDIQPVPLRKDADVRLRDLSDARVTLSADPYLRVRLVARAGSATITEGGVTRDLRPTAFAVLVRRPGVIAASALVLVAGAAVLVRRPARRRTLR
jgi:TIR domain